MIRSHKKTKNHRNHYALTKRTIKLQKRHKIKTNYEYFRIRIPIYPLFVILLFVSDIIAYQDDDDDDLQFN